MIGAEFDCTAVDKKLGEMVDKLRAARHAVPNELFNWEAEDLRRRNPWVKKVGRRNQWQTIIRPHSIREMKRSHAFLVRAHRRRLTLRRFSTRPILRAELMTELENRMNELLATFFKW